MPTVPLNEKSKDEPSAAVNVDVPVCRAVTRSTCDGPSTSSLPTWVPRPLPGICRSRVVGLPPTTTGDVSMVAWNGTELPAYAIDPVCGMTVAPDTAAATRELGGATYYFCSTHCAATFDADSARYTSAAADK